MIDYKDVAILAAAFLAVFALAVTARVLFYSAVLP